MSQDDVMDAGPLRPHRGRARHLCGSMPQRDLDHRETGQPHDRAEIDLFLRCMPPLYRMVPDLLQPPLRHTGFMLKQLPQRRDRHGQAIQPYGVESIPGLRSMPQHLSLDTRTLQPYRRRAGNLLDLP